MSKSLTVVAGNSELVPGEARPASNDGNGGGILLQYVSPGTVSRYQTRVVRGPWRPSPWLVGVTLGLLVAAGLANLASNFGDSYRSMPGSSRLERELYEFIEGMLMTGALFALVMIPGLFVILSQQEAGKDQAVTWRTEPLDEGGSLVFGDEDLLLFIDLLKGKARNCQVLQAYGGNSPIAGTKRFLVLTDCNGNVCHYEIQRG